MNNIRQQFSEDGFYIHPQPIISAEVVQRASEGMHNIRAGIYDTGRPPYESPWNPGDSMDVLCKVEMPHLASKGIYELVSSRELGKLAAQATGAEMIQLWWVQLLYKPTSKAGELTKTNVGMHQDMFYWQNHWEADSKLFTAWIPLIDATPDHGTMIFVNGSNHWGLSNDSDFFGQDLAAQQAALEAKGYQWQTTLANYPAGGVSFHDKLTWHGSGPNRRPEARLALAIHLRTEKSTIKNRRRDGLTEFVEDLHANPVLFGDYQLKG